MSPLRRPTPDLRDDRGQTMTEYAFVLTLIVMVVFATLVLFGPAVARLWSTFTSSF